MNHNKLVRIVIPVWALVVLVAASLACGSSSQNAQEVLKNTAVAPSAIGNTGKPTAASASAESKVQPTDSSAPTKPSPTSIPQKTAAPAPQSLILSAKGLGQEQQSVAYAFEIENPNLGLQRTLASTR